MIEVVDCVGPVIQDYAVAVAGDAGHADIYHNGVGYRLARIVRARNANEAAQLCAAGNPGSRVFASSNPGHIETIRVRRAAS